MSQKNKPLDDLDRKLVAWLAEDGRSSAGDLAQALGVAPPTIRSRIRRLLADGILRVAGLIDPSRVEDVTLALVALTLTKQEELEAKLEQIGGLEQVQWVAVSSGRYGSAGGGLPHGRHPRSVRFSDAHPAGPGWDPVL